MGRTDNQRRNLGSRNDYCVHRRLVAGERVFLDHERVLRGLGYAFRDARKSHDPASRTHRRKNGGRQSAEIISKKKEARMRKIRMTTVIALMCCSAPAIADITNFEIMGLVNPSIESARTRDRSVRFSSARLDALQMSAAIDDDSNALTLENWGDNRAGLAVANKKSFKFTGAGNEYSFSDGDSKYVSGQAGLAGQFNSFQIEASGEHDFPPHSGVSFANADIGLGWKLGDLMLGTHVGGGWSGNAFPQYAIRPGQALAYRIGDEHAGVDLGYTFDGILNRNSNYDEATLKHGGQMIIRPSESMVIGLRGSFGSLRGVYNDGGTRTANPNEAGARILWHVAGLPVDFGAEYAYAKSDGDFALTDYYGASADNDITETNSFRAGIAAHLLDNKLLAGVEYGVTKWTEDEHSTGNSYYYSSDYQYNASNGPKYISIGAELRPIQNLAIRASHRYTETTYNDAYSYNSYWSSYSDVYSAAAISNSTAFGVGWTQGIFRADMVLTHTNIKLPTHSVAMNEGRIELGVAF